MLSWLWQVMANCFVLLRGAIYIYIGIRTYAGLEKRTSIPYPPRTFTHSNLVMTIPVCSFPCNSCRRPFIRFFFRRRCLPLCRRSCHRCLYRCLEPPANQRRGNSCVGRFVTESCLFYPALGVAMITCPSGFACVCVLCVCFARFLFTRGDFSSGEARRVLLASHFVQNKPWRVPWNAPLPYPSQLPPAPSL